LGRTCRTHGGEEKDLPDFGGKILKGEKTFVRMRQRGENSIKILS
jgi:hypothetical protein